MLRDVAAAAAGAAQARLISRSEYGCPLESLSVTVRIADHEAGKPLSEVEKEAAAAAARSVVEQREAGATALPQGDR